MENMQETMDRQEQIIQELNEKIAVLEATVAQTPHRLVGIPITDQQHNEAPHLVQGVSIANPDALQLHNKEWLKEKFDRIEKLEDVVRKSRGPDDYLMDLEGLFDPPKTILPPKFKMPTFEKFDGTGNPKSHLRMYVNTLRPMGLNSDQLALVFHQTLTGGALKWFFALEPSKIQTWEDIATAFAKQYEYNTQVDVTLRDLEITRQDARESISTFIARWRTKAAKMENRPTEKEQIRMLMRNLSPTYYDQMYLLPISTFDQLLETGIKVEDVEREGKLKKEEIHRSRRGYISEGSSINALRVRTQAPRKRKREFSYLGVPLTEALNMLIQSGHLAPLEPTSPPNPLPKSYDPSKYCDFHQGQGHDTSGCARLRHEIQDLINDGVITTPLEGN